MTIHPHEYTSEGFWKGWIAITRSGVFPYKTADDKEIWLRRDPIDVFSEDHLNSLKGMPIVISHPKSSVNAINIGDDDRVPVGAILSQFDYPTDDDGNPTDGYLHAQAVLWTQEAIALARDDNGMVSEGYAFDYSDETGEAIDINDDGEWTMTRPYNGRQRKLKANHVAVLDSEEQGRAGTYARVVFDDESATIVDEVIPLETETISEPENAEPDEIVEPKNSGPDIEPTEATDSLYDLAPVDESGNYTIDNSSDPTFKMIKMIANAASVASWLYIPSNIELTLGNVARCIISAINYSAELPENDDMAIMKAELLLETVRSSYDSEDVEAVVIRIDDSNHGRLTFKPKNAIQTSTPELVSVQPVAIDSRCAPVIEPLPTIADTPKPAPNPRLVQMANDAKRGNGKPDRTSSLYKGWKKP